MTCENDSADEIQQVFEMEYILHRRYGWAVYGFWGAVLLAGMINRLIGSHWTKRMVGSHDVETLHETAASTKGHNGLSSLMMWLQRHLILTPLFGSRHQERLWTCAVPTRLETMVITAYWILNFVLCCVSYEIFFPNL